MLPLVLGLIGAGTGLYYLLKPNPAAGKPISPGMPVPSPPVNNIDSIPGVTYVQDRTAVPTAEQVAGFKDASTIPIPSEDKWSRVDVDGKSYLVAPWYIAPMGIGEAQQIAAAHGYSLPTPALVDAIYKQADLIVPFTPRGAQSHPPSDFTAKTMNSVETHADQESIIAAQIIAARPNLDFTLLAGPYKDVVVGGAREVSQFGNKSLLGHPGIYGARLANGKYVQQFMWGHAADWKDYSQGLRLVKEIA